MLLLWLEKTWHSMLLTAEKQCCNVCQNPADATCMMPSVIYPTSSSSSSSSCGLSLNGCCRFHERPPQRRLTHGKHISWDVPGSSPGKCRQVGWPKTRKIAWNRPQHAQKMHTSTEKTSATYTCTEFAKSQYIVSMFIGFATDTQPPSHTTEWRKQ